MNASYLRGNCNFRQEKTMLSRFSVPLCALVGSLTIACGVPQEGVSEAVSSSEVSSSTTVRSKGVLVGGGETEAGVCDIKERDWSFCSGAHMSPVYAVKCRTEPCVTATNWVATVRVGEYHFYTKRARAQSVDGYDWWLFNDDLKCWSWEGAFAYDCDDGTGTLR